MEDAESAFIDGTEGLLLADMNAIATLARVESVPIGKISDAVRRYKVGVTEDPWLRIDREKIRNAELTIRKRVKGQTHAVTHMLDLVKRAMTGVGVQRKGNRPRGVAFLAGPTGVGKTELAKTLTSLLFGDESAYIRFDMSEFSSEHSDQRLIGAPPGYVGYDVGGELTNAIRERPFSVVLFDEIEKAHPRILDKFLQILDDGVLTSGRGDRVYFSEALIVFTSNLGIFREDELGQRVPNVVPDDSFDDIGTKVLSEIQRHFKLVLNRPEILNRIGENIIVFDFIRENVAQDIFDQMIGAVLDDIASQGISVELDPPLVVALKHRCLSDLSNGGRGIRNQIEAHLINPLARGMFDQDAKPGDSFLVTNIADGELQLHKHQQS
ncbi:ATPase [Pandoraea anhela]|uniref:ATPase n=2 Tax=Pandoraea anhela TaxID=2508295 RepID=A0A5E4YQ92_9BURK|nr:ATPase [Pandoraea anhela]